MFYKKHSPSDSNSCNQPLKKRWKIFSHLLEIAISQNDVSEINKRDVGYSWKIVLQQCPL